MNSLELQSKVALTLCIFLAVPDYAEIVQLLHYRF